MIRLTLTGEERTKKSLSKLSQMDRIVELWMRAGEPDNIFNESTEKRFNSQGGSEKWPGLSQRTIDERVRQGFGSGPVLVRTGNLKDELTNMRGAIKRSTGAVTLSRGVAQLRGKEKVKFSAHQLGKGKSGQVLPQRKMVKIEKKDAEEVKSSLLKWIISQV